MPAEQLAIASALTLANAALMLVLCAYTLKLDGFCRASVVRCLIYAAVVVVLPPYLIAQVALFLLQAGFVLLLVRSWWGSRNQFESESSVPIRLEDVDQEDPKVAERFAAKRKVYESKLKPLIPLAEFDERLKD